MREPIFFEPIYQERVWGGRNLSSALGRKLPKGKVIGESWDMVDREEANSPVANESAKGKTLRQLIESDPEGVMGPGYDASKPFPILVKWLDCEERLSLQVHPPSSVARELGGEPKTENWYIADRKPGASLIVGLKQGTTREEFERRLEDSTLEECVHRFKVEPGSSILVESGRIHAIDAGNLILEIQQNSDTTYRVYDWGRVGLDGKPRDLHVEQSLKCIDWHDFEPTAMDTTGHDVTLADCAEFRLVKRTLVAGQGEHRIDPGQPRILSVVEGEVKVGNDESAVTVKRGDNVLLPAAAAFTIEAASKTASFLITDRFV